MSSFQDSPITVLAGENIPAYSRIRFNGTSWVLASASQTAHAVSRQYIASGDYGAASLANDEGVFAMQAAGAISVGDHVFAAASGEVANTGTIYEGICYKAAADSSDTCEVLKGIPRLKGLLYSNTAASSAVTNTVTATAFDLSYTVAANTLKAGDVLRIKFQGIATATHSTDTLAIELKIGSVTVLSLAAVDVADNDIFEGAMDVVVRTVGASGTIVAHGVAPVIGAAGTATGRSRYLASSTLDTTADEAVTVVATWSVASASNSCRLDVLTVELVRN